jgi:hypothetical protein
VFCACVRACCAAVCVDTVHCVGAACCVESESEREVRDSGFVLVVEMPAEARGAQHSDTR